MKVRNIAGAAGALAAAAVMAAPAGANEGYFSYGYGAVNKSMAGAGVALGLDAMSQAVNPATLVLVETQLSVDVTFASHQGSHEVTGTPSGAADTYGLAQGLFAMEEDRSYIFSIANSWEIDDSSSWGWAIYNSGGAATQWKEPAGGLFGAGDAGMELDQTFLQLTYSQEISPDIYIGFSPILAVQRFRADGLGGLAAFSSDPTKLTDLGYDMSWGYGGKVGVQGELGAGFTFGVAYQTEMFMTDLDDYAGLIVNGGEFNVPATLQLGFAWRAEWGFVAALDYRHIYYGDVDAVGNAVAVLDPATGMLLGSPGGPGFGWSDADIVKLGVQIPLGQYAMLRAGAAMNTNPVGGSESTLNLLTMEAQDRHYTAGLSFRIGDNHSIDLAGMYAPATVVEGTNGLEVPGQQAVTIESKQWEASLGWTWRY